MSPLRQLLFVIGFPFRVLIGSAAGGVVGIVIGTLVGLLALLVSYGVPWLFDQFRNEPSVFRQRFPYLHLVLLFVSVPTLAGVIGGGVGTAVSMIWRNDNITSNIGRIVGGASGLISG